jgi:hypothetical protein
MGKPVERRGRKASGLLDLVQQQVQRQRGCRMNRVGPRSDASCVDRRFIRGRARVRSQPSDLSSRFSDECVSPAGHPQRASGVICRSGRRSYWRRRRRSDAAHGGAARRLYGRGSESAGGNDAAGATGGPGAHAGQQSARNQRHACGVRAGGDRPTHSRRPRATPTMTFWSFPQPTCPRGRSSAPRRASLTGTPGDAHVGETQDITITVSDGRDATIEIANPGLATYVVFRRQGVLERGRGKRTLQRREQDDSVTQQELRRIRPKSAPHREAAAGVSARRARILAPCATAGP